jgi:hypothetical protein
MAGGANGLVGREKKFFVGCECWEAALALGARYGVARGDFRA